MKRVGLLLLVCATACTQPAPPPEPPRVVRTLTLSAAPVAAFHEFSGEIKPRIESRLGFRVSGKITERLVEVGARVVRGQPLARLDAQDFSLAVRAADSKVVAASTALDSARADFNRFTALRDKGFISEAELERHRSQFAAATAALDAARSEASFQRNQLDYTTLKATEAGVVTRIDAEAGQVVAAGMLVVTLAQEGAQEVAIFVPEDKLALLRAPHDLTISLWAAPGQQWPGRVREIAPSADPITRTYAVRISVQNGAPLQLGMSATVRLAAREAPAQIRLPLAALMMDGGGSAVFVVEPQTRTLRRQPVVVGETVGNEVRITSGVAQGQVVVTAGLNLLHEGQVVRPQAAP